MKKIRRDEKMVGHKREGQDTVHISITVHPEHVRILEKILRKEYRKTIIHKSVSEIIRRAIEHYAEFLGVEI